MTVKELIDEYPKLLNSDVDCLEFILVYHATETLETFDKDDMDNINTLEHYNKIVEYLREYK